MISSCVDGISRLVARIRRRRRIVLDGNVVKVNVGSSIYVADGWINIDGGPHLLFSGWPTAVLRFTYRFSDAKNWCGDETYYVSQLKTHRFVHHNLEYGLPLVSESVDFLYSSHVLEHFYPDTAERILREAYRVLKKGGRLRICVPDLHHAFELYEQGSKEEALRYFFEPKSGFNRHRYMYDFELLSSLLKKVGFGSVQRCAFQQGLVPDLDRLDNRSGETLYVECAR